MFLGKDFGADKDRFEVLVSVIFRQVLEDIDCRKGSALRFFSDVAVLLYSLKPLTTTCWKTSSFPNIPSEAMYFHTFKLVPFHMSANLPPHYMYCLGSESFDHSL